MLLEPNTPSSVAATPPPLPPPPLEGGADFARAVRDLEESAHPGVWTGPRGRVTFRTLGDGPLLILVPGIAATYRGYAMLMQHLSQRFRVAIYDYPGDNPDDGYDCRQLTHADLVDDLLGLAAALSPDPVHLLGVSFGSTLTLAAMLRAPHRVAASALQGGFAYRPFGLGERLALAFGRRIPGNSQRLPFRRLALHWKHHAHFPPDHPDRWLHYVYENGLTPIQPLACRLQLLYDLDLRSQLPNIPHRISLIQGEWDPLIPWPYFLTLRENLPGGWPRVLPGVGHQPHYTHPLWFGSIVIQDLLGVL